MPLSFNVPGAGYSQHGPLHPMFFKLGVPIGALVFWVRRPSSRQDPLPESQSPAAA
jgi:hypothetical protein